MQRITVVILLLVLALPAAIHAQEGELPDQVTANYPGLHPEGIEWDAEAGHFLVGSLTTGGLFTLTDDGTVTPLGTNPQVGLSSVGVHLDGDRVLVAMSDFAAGSDPNVPGVAALAVYDRTTGEQLAFVVASDVLGEGRHFGNDVTADADGNAYLTDSFSPVIYKIDPDGVASVFLQDEALGVEGFGLNGIDYSEAGNYLLAAVSGKGTIYKIPVDDPASFTEVELSETLGIDGMVLDDNNNLIAVATTYTDAGERREIVQLASSDDWATAEVTARTVTLPEASPTTLALRDGVPYVTHAHFDAIGAETPLAEFEIVRANFEDAESAE
ncbi:MAG TPA: SMP-30/gluconolactonase/LRE family protein [Aggregatilineaceae bacterium]|nr:SMP-30/gluconolactonase/LRE family protein [Aggregatilineaceae bacterium]